MFRINSTYLLLGIILIMLAFLFNRYTEKQKKEHKMDNQYSAIQKYLLNENTTVKDLEKMDKPIMWIHIVNEYNSRMWESFGSRSSFHLNQPYMYLTVKSILAKCEDSFHICLIDDNSFAMLLPNWRIDISKLSDPILDNIRQLALAKILHTYGGFLVPPSFLCMKNLIDLYDRGTQNGNRMFVCETVDRNVTSTTNNMYPNIRFMGAPKENHTIKDFINFMERTISDDYTSQIHFLGEFDQWCDNKITKGRMRLIPGTDVGIKSIDDEPVTIKILLGENYIHFYEKMYGIWIPDKMILKRRHYEWFARMSPEQIFDSQFILAKYFVLALAPDSHMGVIEPMKNVDPNWISFWRVPINADSRTLNIFGPMPMGIGNNVPRAKNAGNLP